MKKVTPEFIRDIFYSGQFGFMGDKDVTSKIAFLVNNNYLLLSPVTIATKKEYMEACTNDSFIVNRDDAAGGSHEHVALKIVGQSYIKKEYGVDSVFEQTFAGYFPDVQSIDKHIICECGHTNNPEKLFEYFKHNEIRYIVQIPYPDTSDEVIMGYEFQAMPDLIPFLALESQEISQSIKDILNRR